MIVKRHDLETEKTNHKLGDNICKTHLMKDNYPEYIKNFSNSIIRNQTTQLTKNKKRQANDLNRHFTKEEK